MGRTGRTRSKRRKTSSGIRHPEEDLSVLAQMDDWMRSNGWYPTCNLIPHIFPVTRRGLGSLEDIEADTPLAVIPMRLLITTSIVAASGIKHIFLSNKNYTAQSVLATFLIFEKHLESDSSWKCYLNNLPSTYTVPDYCTNEEKRRFPSYLAQETRIQNRKMINDFKIIQESISELKKADSDVCCHCKLNLGQLFTFLEYKWAYYTVNTRAVYLDIRKDVKEMKDVQKINIQGEDNLALAPYLDLFNHTYDASVKVNLIIDKNEEYYQIYTLKPIENGTEVFINYGTYCNLKLYTEYGFCISNNPLDEVLVDYLEIKKCVPVSEAAHDFIVTNKFNKDIGFTSNGLNFSAKIVFFILSTALQAEKWKLKIYTYDFDSQDLIFINKIACKILNMKKIDLMGDLNKMDGQSNKSESFKIAVDLIKEYISILNNALDCISKELFLLENK